MPLLPALALSALLTAPGQSPTITPGSVLLMAAGTQVDEPLLAAALADSNPLVRAAAGRVITVFSPVKLVGAVVSALEKETDEQVAAELTRALLILRGDAALPLIETHAQRIGGAPGKVLTAWRERQRDAAAPAQPMPNDLMFSRLVSLWLPGLLTDLSQAAGCKLPDREFGYARVTYRADGRASQVAIDPGRLSKQCALVLAAIGRTTLADPDERVQHGHQQWVVVPFSKAYAQCTDERPTPPVRAGTSGIRAPKKVKDVRPDYPEDMRQQRIQGMVVVGATISTQGCVVGGRVLKSPAFGLELSALRAVSGWVFEPTLLDGKPVPVYMTVIVTFTLR